MAITDITFTEGDKQMFTLEIAAGALNAPADELVETGGSQYPVLETTIDIEPQEGHVFIITE